MALKETSACQIGWKAKDFELIGIDNKPYNIKAQMGKNGLLIAFICNHCPYVKAIIERFVEDSNILIKNGINVLCIMSNDYTEYEEDSPENMKLFAQENNFTFPYLIDEDQKVAKAYDGICTPDFFGFNNKFELQYRGRLDDAKMEDPKNRNPELLNAMLEISKNGSFPGEQYPSIGCSIKWKS